MEDAYQEVPYSEPEPKKGMSGWLIALIIIGALVVICCLCLLIVVVLAPTLLGPAMGNVFSTIIETVEATTPMP
jgi:hypothetical protein